MAGSSHGHTPAAWTGVTISFIGFCVAGVFMVAANSPGFWAGIGVILLGGVVGLAMKAAGLGMPKESEALVRARQQAGERQVQAPAQAPAQPVGATAKAEATSEPQTQTV
ncbi:MULTISPECIES: HGxxPAAW family protein [unclassified Streptomyces]|uniref:HGxxPAAW family protein n=1 Tax=unclassified Streptomyces TaxID=2593676 RepID=UPI0034185176